MPSTRRRVSISLAKIANMPIIRAITTSAWINLHDGPAGAFCPQMVVKSEALQHQRREGHRDVEHPVDRFPDITGSTPMPSQSGPDPRISHASQNASQTNRASVNWSAWMRKASLRLMAMDY